MFFPKKIYCRVFQEVFHMAIPFLPYRKPALLHHTDALVPLFQRKGISRILLVTDPVVRGNQITYPLETSLKQASIDCIVYDQTVSNPTTDQVEEAVHYTTPITVRQSSVLAAVLPLTVPKL